MPHRVQSTKSRNGLIVLFVLLIGGFSLLAYRQEVQLKATQEASYRQCIARNFNVDKLNTFYNGMIAVERANPYAAVSPETIETRINLYELVMLDRIECKKTEKS